MSEHEDFDNSFQYWKKLLWNSIGLYSHKATIPFSDEDERSWLISLFTEYGFEGYTTRRSDNMVIFVMAKRLSIHRMVDMYVEGKITKDQAMSWITKSTDVSPDFYPLISMYSLPAEEFIEKLVFIKMSAV